MSLSDSIMIQTLLKEQTPSNNSSASIPVRTTKIQQMREQKARENANPNQRLTWQSNKPQEKPWQRPAF